MAADIGKEADGGKLELNTRRTEFATI